MPTVTNAIVTFYCACTICCGPGNPAARRTASGTRPVVGQTIAAPRQIPFGSVVQLREVWSSVNQHSRRNHVLIVEDRTARRYEGRWDIFVRTHAEARKLGKQRLTITWTEP